MEGREDEGEGKERRMERRIKWPDEAPPSLPHVDTIETSSSTSCLWRCFFRFSIPVPTFVEEEKRGRRRECANGKEGVTEATFRTQQPTLGIPYEC